MTWRASVCTSLQRGQCESASDPSICVTVIRRRSSEEDMATGKASEARAMFADAAPVRRTVLGPDHPLTKASESGAE